MKTIQTFEEFQTAINNPINLFFFKTHTCSVCTAVAPKVEAFLKDYPAVFGFAVWADLQPKIRGRMLVFSAPTVILFKDGQEIHRQSRFIDFEELKRQIENAL
jgi:thioredoxin-like negative regulator of GroEL